MYTPVNNRILVKPYEQPQESTGGIFIPEGARPKPQKGVVVAKGPGKLMPDGTRSKMLTKINDVVVFQKFGGIQIEINETLFLVLDEDEVLLIESFELETEEL